MPQGSTRFPARMRQPTRSTYNTGLSTMLAALSLLIWAVLTILLLSIFLEQRRQFVGLPTINDAPGMAPLAISRPSRPSSPRCRRPPRRRLGRWGFGSISVATLQGDNPSALLRERTDRNWTTVSVATSAVTPAGGPSAVCDGFSGIDPNSGADFVTGGRAAGGGTIRWPPFAAGACFRLIWSSGGGQTMYGAQTGLQSSSHRSSRRHHRAGPVASTTIGSQQNGFPRGVVTPGCRRSHVRRGGPSSRSGPAGSRPAGRIRRAAIPR